MRSRSGKKASDVRRRAFTRADAASVRHSRLRRLDRDCVGGLRLCRGPHQGRDAGGTGARDLDVDGIELVGSDRVADVHLDGRDSLSHQIVRRHVRRLGAVAAETAGAPAARERDWLRHFRRRVRFIGRHLRHHRPHRAAGIAQARLRRAHGDRHTGRLGHAWAADPALDHHDRLRHRDRPVDRAAVHCRGHSGDRARRTFHGLHRGVGVVQSNAHAAARTAGPVSRARLCIAAAYPGDAC